MGIRFAASGGREGWTRTALTAVGVALGVAVLLIGASVPTLMNAWHGREKARENLGQMHEPPRGDTTVRYASADTVFHGEPIRGRLVRPDGAHPPVPPGMDRLPGPGEMRVSPALRELLAEPGSALLRQRLPYKIVGVIGDAGLQGPAELTYVAGSTALRPPAGYRIDHFGKGWTPRPLTPQGTLLVIMTCVALLTPVTVFLGTSARFGHDRRERRLAALRLLGSDIATTRRIAAGEALFGSALGLAGGAVLFLAARQTAGWITLWDINVFPADVRPGALPAALIAVLVPAVSVLVTLFAQRGVTVDPLGVVHRRPAPRRRFWWRLLPPVLGAALLLPLLRQRVWEDSAANTTMLAAGSMLLLFGVTALLPWLVEAVVGRLRGGPVPWQLAIRRLQASGGSATRAVGGITVAVAGAIAIHMLFTGMQFGFTQAYARSGALPRIGYTTQAESWQQTERALAAVRATPGATDAQGVIEATLDTLPTSDSFLNLAIGSCAELRRVATLGSCRDGDVFVTQGRDRAARPGATLDLNPPFAPEDRPTPHPWTLPADARQVPLRHLGDGPDDHRYEILATPSTVDVRRLAMGDMALRIGFDRSVPDAVERIRTSMAKVTPTLYESSAVDNPHDRAYSGIRNGLFAAAAVTLLLIGAGLIISTVEQLHERRRVLSSLHAFGVRRSGLGWSVLWQTAVPVLLGLVLAVGCGLLLGTLLLRMINAEVRVDWPVVAGMAGIGGGVILFVTALSLPPLWRMMRPEGLRTE
ncbi:ABC transporter permease [Streptomyces catenulae]|uniref:FtsX-like permease family protein n=1 Tax=Streptomyces catenulae TaxID=66875 RepID=A0ABV2YUC3_9ACTN|nr:FtsX-like permease family protein [Streptomyces catenulae]